MLACQLDQLDQIKSFGVHNDSMLANIVSSIPSFPLLSLCLQFIDEKDSENYMDEIGFDCDVNPKSQL